ncbi:MAG: DUF1624 domain-containing protein [Clostridia bacterium]|nr:DUF1624 domain-containing protein [Clostridia bacterium]
MEKNASRIPWIDELRGISILAMIIHHIAFNLIYFLRLPLPWLSGFLNGDVFLAVQTVFIAIFLGLSGVCSHFSRHPYKRAAKVLFGASLVTLVTYILYPDEAIYFGILHFLGISMLFAAVLRKMPRIKKPLLWAAVSLLWFLVMFHLPDGYLGFGPLSVRLPKALYRGGFLMPLGFASPHSASLDYFPVFPYIFLFLAGFFLGQLPLPKGRSHAPFLALCGRKSLWIYLLHQPVIFGIFLLLEKIL